MKIAVCVKQVPDATVHKRLDPDTNRLDRSGEGALNATDVNAVEEALRLKEVLLRGRRLSWNRPGPEKAMDSHSGRRSRWARTAPCSSPTTRRPAPTSRPTSRALAKALEREEADLVLFGQQSSDIGHGVVLWAAVSDRLRRPMVSQVAELTVDGDAVTGKRQDRQFGYDVIAAPLPAVVAVSDAINEPALPVPQGDHGREVEAAGGHLALRPRRRSRRGGRGRLRGPPRARAAPPPAKSDQVKIEDDGSGAEKIVDYLAEKRLI